MQEKAKSGKNGKKVKKIKKKKILGIGGKVIFKERSADKFSEFEPVT